MHCRRGVERPHSPLCPNSLAALRSSRSTETRYPGRTSDAQHSIMREQAFRDEFEFLREELIASGRLVNVVTTYSTTEMKSP